MRLYELNCLLSPDLLSSKEEGETFQKKIESLIEGEDGIVTDSKNPFKKNLGYPIKNKKEVFLITLNFNLSPEKLGSLEKKLKGESEIFRYLILTKKLPKISPLEGKKIPLYSSSSSSSSSNDRILSSEVQRDKRMAKQPPLPPKEKKVELKEIEKKLEEILGQ